MKGIYTSILYHKYFVICMILATIIFTSCNVKVDMHISRVQGETELSHVQSDINIKVEVAKFFVEYLSDLLGVDGIQGIMEKISLEAFLLAKESVDSATVNIDTSSKEVATVNISMFANNIVNMLESMDVPVAIEELQSRQQFELDITREFLVSFLNNIPELREMSIIESLLPDEETVAQADFPEYIAWSFSEYKDEESIINILNNSKFIITLKKGKNGNRNMLDLNWNRIYITRDDTMEVVPAMQQQSLKLVPLLYNTNNNVVFTF